MREETTKTLLAIKRIIITTVESDEKVEELGNLLTEYTRLIREEAREELE